VKQWLKGEVYSVFVLSAADGTAESLIFDEGNG
jgi:hypothetical protein